MNIPTRVGDRYLCFVLVRRVNHTVGGPYGTVDRWPVFQCEDCGHEIESAYTTFNGVRRYAKWALKRMLDHHECGHAPCAECGQMLLRRKDGTPRQHRYDLCPGKTPGSKIEREFVRNMTTREYA